LQFLQVCRRTVTPTIFKSLSSTADNEGNLEHDAGKDDDSEESEDGYAAESEDQHLGTLLSNEVDREENLNTSSGDASDMFQSEEGMTSECALFFRWL